MTQPSSLFHFMLSTPVGPLFGLVEEGGALVALAFADERELARLAACEPGAWRHDDRVSRPAVEQLQAYFGRARRDFSLSLAPRIGTAFQRRVWSALEGIPYGQTWSYAQLATAVGSVARAVGGANGANPLPLVWPCHRVIGATGALVGYAGGLDRKAWLLRHEGALAAEAQSQWC